MQLKTIKKINLKLFLPLSLSSLMFFLFLTKSKIETTLLLVNYITTLLYLLIFSETIMLLIGQYTEEKVQINKKKIVFLFIFKLLFLLIPLFYSAEILKVRVLLPLSNYLIHIFILYFSFKKIEEIKVSNTSTEEYKLYL